jgi:hypothetical protein
VRATPAGVPRGIDEAPTSGASWVRLNERVRLAGHESQPQPDIISGIGEAWLIIAQQDADDGEQRQEPDTDGNHRDTSAAWSPWTLGPIAEVRRVDNQNTYLTIDYLIDAGLSSILPND